MTEQTQRPPLPAATVVVLRDADHGPEVLLIRRHGKSAFMPGATVFPGGKIDAVDGTAHLAAPAVELPDFTASSSAAAHVAAIRELHEEAHVLLAVDVDGQTPPASVVSQLDTAIETLRDGHRLRAEDWHRTLQAFELRPDPRLVAAFAHWLTPQAEPRRFDTVFFAAVLPQGQVASLDQHETTELCWLRPADAVAAHLSGGPTLLPPPTLHTLQRLAVLAVDRDATQIVTILGDQGLGPLLMPHFVADAPTGPTIALPWDPLHPDAHAYVRTHAAQLQQMTAVAHLTDSTPRHDRFVLREGRFTRVIE